MAAPLAGGARPNWLSVFLDFASTEFAAGTRFWSAATGYALSPPRGESDEFATLVPPDGHDFLRVQRLGDGLSRVHLDVHVAEPVLVAEAVEAIGATLVHSSPHGYVVMRSPAGVVFCLVRHSSVVVPPLAAWPDGHHSRVGQVCLDIPGAEYTREVAFWRELLGGDWTRPDPTDPLVFREAGEFAVDLRLQPSQLASDPLGHLHIVTDDRSAEVERLVEAGAVVRAAREAAIVLEPPGGVPVCVVDLLRDGIACRA